MKKRADARDEAVSIQVGFVLNTGMLTAFIAIVLVILSGGFGDDISTEEELEIVADSIEANMVEADRLAVTSDSYTAFFEPPSSDLDYRAEVDSSGELSLTVPGEPVTVTRDLDSMTRNDVNGNDINFGQNTENIILEYDGSSSAIEMSVQQDVVS